MAITYPNKKAEPEKKATTQQEVFEATDIIVADGEYLLKPLQHCGTLDSVASSIAKRLAKARKGGYRYIDRIPANAQESVLIFEKID